MAKIGTIFQNPIHTSGLKVNGTLLHLAIIHAQSHITEMIIDQGLKHELFEKMMGKLFLNNS